MRLALTVVHPQLRQQAHIVLDAAPATPVAEIATALSRFADGGQPAADGALSLYVDGQLVSPGTSVAESRIRDGAVVSLGGPGGCPGPGPARPAAPALPSGSLTRSADGTGADFNRPPRLLPPRRAARFALPSPPAPAERRPLPVLTAVLPLIMGAAMAFFLHQVYLLAMAGLSPVLLVGSVVSERRQGRKSDAARQGEYAAHKARIERDVAGALHAERLARREQCPDPATVLATAAGPGSRLWERRRTDPDYLLLRVGTADLPSAVELTDPERDEHRRTVVPDVPDVPAAIPLAERGVIGLAGPPGSAQAAGRWLVAQAAVLHSPHDLRIYVLTDTAGKASWEWVRWLPHCRPGPGGSCTAQVGNDAESVAARVAELLAVIAQRREARTSAGYGHAAVTGPAGAAGGRELPWHQTEVMVVLDGARKLRALPGVVQVLREGPEAGVYVVCLDSDERLLPAECQAVAAFGPDGLRVQQAMAATVRGVRPDQVSPRWCARVARAVAPVRDVTADEEGDGIPDAARLLDILGLGVPRQDMAGVIAARWRAAGRSTLAVAGASYDGPFGIDISRDGPHGLIAGTTGSGKSEFLQALVAALAVANRPDELAFVLVDYKGGSAFADCALLPHTVGMVTDLSPHLVERALVSLSAELTRREHLLAAADAKDIEDYQRSPGGRPAPLPRLVIVIDEFASLVRDLPDFVTGLVSIAQRGRSLGIHLMLATQRPSGVVSADIRANTNLRIALRVTDKGESADVIDAPEAASITKATPGRAYVRLGHASLVPFQTGRVSGRYPAGPAARRAEAGTWLAPVSWADLGRPEPAGPAGRRPAEEEITDLKVLAEQIRLAASALGIPAQPSPWLPPLPAAVQLNGIWPAGTAQLGGGDGGGCGLPGTRGGGWRQRAEWDRALVPYGIADFPARQAREPAGLSLAAVGHLIAAGAPRSGRSQLLRTICGALALAHSCADVHVYGLDCGNGALLPIAELPHCGAVVSRTEAERAARLLRRLDAELSGRQELLAAGGFADITEQRANPAAPGPGTGPGDLPLPHVFLLIDRWEGFTASLGESDGGVLTEIVTRILSEGASAGLHLIMTGDRSLLAGRISSLCEDKLVFRLADREDYSLAGLRARDLPDDVPPGRAFRAVSGTEVQTALLGPDPAGQAQATALRAVAGLCALRDEAVPGAARPFRVDAAPGRITFGQAWALRPAPLPPLWGLVGVGGDSLRALGPDLGTGVPAFIVAGPGRSGRSTILVAMARSLLKAGTRVVAVTPRPSPLHSLAEAPGVQRVFTGASLTEEELAGALAAVDGPGVVIVDDAELLRDCDAASLLGELLTVPGRGLVIAGDPEAGLCAGFGGWQVEAKRARRGCLTAPSAPGDGELAGVRLTRSQLGQPPRPGRCLLNAGDGNLVTVTVPRG